MTSRPKVFGIGFHKTGTSSLGEALRQLGYSPVANYSPALLPAIKSKNWEQVKEFCQPYQAFEDNPWPLIYSELDALFPGSKLILTLRPPEKWVSSLTNHFSGSTTAMRQFIYGDSYGDPTNAQERYLVRYNQHNQRVLNYFANRPNDFALVDWEMGHGWAEICKLLDCDVPERPFPHTNSKSSAAY